MKTITLYFVAALIFFTTASFAQENKPVFETASLTKAADGTTCVQLTWKRGAENTAYYIIERSVDGKAFKQVAVVFSSEDAQWTAYKYRDKSVMTSASVYYRIGIVNDQKEIAYLPVKSVDASSPDLTAATPVLAEKSK